MLVIINNLFDISSVHSSSSRLQISYNDYAYVISNLLVCRSLHLGTRTCVCKGIAALESVFMFVSCEVTFSGRIVDLHGKGSNFTRHGLSRYWLGRFEVLGIVLM